MQEQLWNQLVQVLQDKAGLSPEQAQQAAQAASDFATEHAGELVQLAASQTGVGGAEGIQSALGKLMGRS